MLWGNTFEMFLTVRKLLLRGPQAPRAMNCWCVMPCSYCCCCCYCPSQAEPEPTLLTEFMQQRDSEQVMH
jgi:hypothetical protein